MLMFSIEKLTEKMKLTITKKIDSEYKGHSILMGLLVIIELLGFGRTEENQELHG